MANPHYQRVLEQDRQLPAPVRWMTRAMSSWWAIIGLGVCVAGYTAAAYVPVGGRYLWQSRWIDTTQHAVLTWWPLQTAAFLLAAVVVWSAMRRLPMRWANLGRFVAVIGLAITLVSQAIAWRHASLTGIIAAPSSSTLSNPNAQAPPSFVTRYADTDDRELMIMVGWDMPIHVPLDGLPRWNDTAGDAMPAMRLNEHPPLATKLGFTTRIRTIAYIADGELVTQPDGTQAVTPTAPSDRRPADLPYPDKALLALSFEAELPDGTVKTTRLWLPFEPVEQCVHQMAPERFFQIEGLGEVGLAFRPRIGKLPFAVAATISRDKASLGTIDLAEMSDLGRPNLGESQRMPRLFDRPMQHAAPDAQGIMRGFQLRWLTVTDDEDVLIRITARPALVYVEAGLCTLALGVVLAGLQILIARLRRYGRTPNAEGRRAPA